VTSKELDRTEFLSSSIRAAELVLGVVTPLGTDVDFVERTVSERITQFGYQAESVRLSALIRGFKGLKTSLEEAPYERRLHTYMNAGNELRDNCGRGDALALAAVGRICELRQQRDGSAGPRARTLYFVRSLKHPEEVSTLREVYGPGFFALGVTAPRGKRLDYLRTEKAVPAGEAEALVKRDECEEEGHGQQTRDAFHLADAFVTLGPNEEENKRQLWRLLDLLFGHPFITPWLDEYAMFLAYAASLRSADLSRQVGAIIVSAAKEIIATGANDVPTAEGGQYWSERFVDWPASMPENDRRDWALGYDSNKKQRGIIIEEVAERVLKNERERVTAALRAAAAENELDAATVEKAIELATGTLYPQQAELERTLKGATVMNLTEYGRAVHAEMAALLCCARVGVSPAGGALYCTTFPCHNCTKHIVAAGLREVLYVEPYPKSLAEELHGDAVVVTTGEASEPTSGKVVFRPFTGVGPRRFVDLFSMTLSTGRPMDRKAAMPRNWSRNSAQLRFSMVPTSYMERERGALATLTSAIPGAHHVHPKK
jgi:deoxycytidylate deaminase